MEVVLVGGKDSNVFKFLKKTQSGAWVGLDSRSQAPVRSWRLRMHGIREGLFCLSVEG